MAEQGTEELIRGLNEDLRGEFQAVIMYRLYASMVQGPYRQELRAFFSSEIPEELRSSFAVLRPVRQPPHPLDEARGALESGDRPFKVALGRAVGEHEPAHRVGAILVDDRLGVDGVLAVGEGRELGGDGLGAVFLWLGLRLRARRRPADAALLFKYSIYYLWALSAALVEALRGKPYVPAAGVEYPTDSFGKGLREVARLIKANVGLEARCVEVEAHPAAHVERAAGVGAGRQVQESEPAVPFRGERRGPVRRGVPRSRIAGPRIARSSSPVATSRLSRICSASSRNRAPRASSAKNQTGYST